MRNVKLGLKPTANAAARIFRILDGVLPAGKTPITRKGQNCQTIASPNQVRLSQVYPPKSRSSAPPQCKK